MRETTNKQEPSSTEGGQVKVGDKVWVLCEVVMVYKDQDFPYVDVEHDGTVFQAIKKQCRPVEPQAKQPTQGQKLAEQALKGIWAANDAVSGTPAIKESLITESSPPKIPDSSSEPLRDAFEADLIQLMGWNQGYFGRNENRYFDSSVEMAWQAFQAGTKYQPSPLASSPCTNGVNVDQFIDGVIEARGRASDFRVGDAVRFVSPEHKRHGTQGILKSIHHGPKNAYMFVSNCGQFHRYCTIAELEHYDQADPVDIKGSMQSLDGADTIQAGDLQWTDRDGKYRLCNFTIGMRIHEAIQRGKAHGEKWVFYRKFREVGE